MGAGELVFRRNCKEERKEKKVSTLRSSNLWPSIHPDSIQIFVSKYENGAEATEKRNPSDVKSAI